MDNSSSHSEIDRTAAELQTVRDLLRYAMSRFAQAAIVHGHGTTSALDEAAFIILEMLKLPVEDINPWLDARLLPKERLAITKLIHTRIETRKPAAYLLGRTYIHGVPFRADERALVPRSYLGELLFSERFGGDEAPLIENLSSVARVLDLCTGSGSLAILAAMVLPDARIDAADISPEALSLARENVADHGLESRVRLFKGDLYAPLGKTRYDLILSNPPYVDAEMMADLPPEYRHEPALALDGGPDGLAILRRILAQARAHLTPGGGLLCEVGRSRQALEAAFPKLPFLWIDTEESTGEVFWLTREQL